MSISERLKQVAGDVLGLPPAEIADDASAQSIESWDSVTHLALVLAVESEFGIEFDAEEIPALVSLPEIAKRLSASGQA